ncbi:MAG TPA: peptide chain release factor N(5)-glutamine methyltransferase [Saprospiraceae bacterium]|nr:peptide chain release factor N(5)-glutamine methyltransferase [Saprospiraceae bacterium]
MGIWNLKKVAGAISDLDISDGREAENLAGWVWEEIMGFSSADEINTTPDQEEKITSSIKRIAAGEPVQYIAGHAWFYGMRLNVTPDVLIPRPETEELVAWIIEDVKNIPSKDIRILDIGTGSGCISIALKKLLKNKTDIVAIDISKPALEVASGNAHLYGLDINFIQRDFLNDELQGLGLFDVIVSNPPYISNEYKESSVSKQLQFEPEIALYPRGDDPVIFYKKIASACRELLAPGGAIYLEMNEFRAEEIRDCFQKGEWAEIRIRKDLQGAERMLRVRS